MHGNVKLGKKQCVLRDVSSTTPRFHRSRIDSPETNTSIPPQNHHLLYILSNTIHSHNLNIQSLLTNHDLHNRKSLCDEIRVSLLTETSQSQLENLLLTLNLHLSWWGWIIVGVSPGGRMKLIYGRRGSCHTFDVEALWGIATRKAGSPDANANKSRHRLGRCSFESLPSLLNPSH